MVWVEGFEAGRCGGGVETSFGNVTWYSSRLVQLTGQHGSQM